MERRVGRARRCKKADTRREGRKEGRVGGRVEGKVKGRKVGGGEDEATK